MDEAREATNDIIRLYRTCLLAPEVTPFSGGLLDGWPCLFAQAYGVLRREDEAISLLAKDTAEREAKRHGGRHHQG